MSLVRSDVLDRKAVKMIVISLRLILYQEYIGVKHAKYQILLNPSNNERIISIIFLHFQLHFLESEAVRKIIKSCQNVIVTNFIAKDSLGSFPQRNANRIGRANLSLVLGVRALSCCRPARPCVVPASVPGLTCAEMFSSQGVWEFGPYYFTALRLEKYRTGNLFGFWTLFKEVTEEYQS